MRHEQQALLATDQRRTVASRRRAYALAGIAVLALPCVAMAATYKWTDDNGVVHYTDKVPPEQVDKARIELNTQGVPVKKIDPALTPAQRKAKEAEEARAREVARQQEEIARKNRALLQSYTSEAEIELARKRALSTLDEIIQSAQAYSEQLVKRKSDVERKKAQFGDKGGVPAALEREATTVEIELARQSELIAQKKREAEQVNAKYGAELARWRELTKSRDTAEAAMGAPPAPGGGYASDAPKK
jgi:hypothetical protein